MKHAVFIAGIVMAATSLTAVSALAQGPGRHGERMTFQELDLDGDGEITIVEMKQHGAARFTEADANGDGMLSSEEMLVGAQKRAEDRVQQMISEFDTNGDGALSQDEMPKRPGPERMFDHADQDGSGGISEEEFAEAGKHMKGHHKKEHHKKGHCDGNKAPENDNN